MQMRNREAGDFVGNESFHEMIDFPTVEELLTALDASLAQVPLLSCSATVAATSRDVAQQWREITELKWEIEQTKNKEQPLDSWVADQWFVTDIPVEPDFMIDFARFLKDRLTKRLREMRQAQHLLRDELAKLRV